MKTMKACYLPWVALILTGCNPLNPIQSTIPEPDPAIANLNLPEATVISVGDGDTLRMDYQGENITVRLACIDTPETSQIPWGPAATERLRQLTPRDSTIQFREADTDRYGRLVAEIYANGQNVNLQMVAEGYAPVYTQFLSSGPDTQAQLLQAEAQAQQKSSTSGVRRIPSCPGTIGAVDNHLSFEGIDLILETSHVLMEGAEVVPIGFTTVHS